MRIYRVVCDLIESIVILNLAKAESIANEEPQPEGAGGSQVEHAHSFTSEPEMHAGWRPSDIGWDDRAHISLRWHPEG